MPSTAITRSRLALHRRTVETFGYPDIVAGALLIWWPATADATTCTVAIPCIQPPVRAQNKDLSGLLTLPVDDVTFHADPSHFPFPPRPEVIFMHGPAVAGSGGALVFDPGTAVKYRLTSLSGGNGIHLRLSAQRH